MTQLELFAGVAVAPQVAQSAIDLRTYCKVCRRAPRSFCAECKTRTVAFKGNCELLRSNFLHHAVADRVTLRLVDKNGETYDFTDSVPGVREHCGLLLAADVCGGELNGAFDDVT